MIAMASSGLRRSLTYFTQESVISALTTRAHNPQLIPPPVIACTAKKDSRQNHLNHDGGFAGQFQDLLLIYVLVFVFRSAFG